MPRSNNVVVLLTALTAVVAAYPGMGRIPDGVTHEDLIAMVGRGGPNGAKYSARADDKEAIGDLLNIPDNNLSDVGKDVKGILTADGSAVSSDSVDAVPDLGSNECAADKCCVWKHVANDLITKFRDGNGCTEPARASIRLGFHDAAGWSKFTGDLGGADGSIVLAPEELGRSLNKGLEDIVAQMKVWHDKYSKFGAGMADLIQFAATTATVACPGGPRIKTFVGRKDSSVACPDGLLPDPRDHADRLIDLFANKTITPPGLAALVGAHTVSRQRFFDVARANAPEDTTPTTWDVLFYQQTLAAGPSEIVTFPSDTALSQDPRSAPAFKTFAEQTPLWDAAYAREYLRLSLLGVFNINELTDCTRALPSA